jgi:hypothetical protein
MVVICLSGKPLVLPACAAMSLSTASMPVWVPLSWRKLAASPPIVSVSQLSVLMTNDMVIFCPMASMTTS